MASSDAVVTARAKEKPWSRWLKPTGWIGRKAKENEGAKEVEPDGHGKATHDHKLYLPS